MRPTRLFQSTPPHGGRQICPSIKSGCICFNPRPRMEGDHFGRLYSTHNYCFNPRPRMEGDNSGVNSNSPILRFNPRPRMEGDEADWVHVGSWIVSIHAPAWRATVKARHCTVLDQNLFLLRIFHSKKKSTRNVLCKIMTLCYFAMVKIRLRTSCHFMAVRGSQASLRPLIAHPYQWPLWHQYAQPCASS